MPAPCRKGDIKLAMAGALDTKREVQQVFVIGEGFRSSSACGRSGSPWAGRDDAAQASICQG